MCGSMAGIQSAVAENRGGKEEETTVRNIMACPIP